MGRTSVGELRARKLQLQYSRYPTAAMLSSRGARQSSWIPSARCGLDG